MPSSLVTSPPLYRIIADAIRAGITAGVLKPGDVLPSRAQLAAGHKASEAPVRQALALLEAEGLIILRQGKRATVAGEQS